MVHSGRMLSRDIKLKVQNRPRVPAHCTVRNRQLIVLTLVAIIFQYWLLFSSSECPKDVRKEIARYLESKAKFARNRIRHLLACGV